MDPQGYVVLIGAVSRAITLAIAGAGGICCIFLGWFLYRDGIKVATAGLVDHKDFKLKLTTSGPGVFLVAFGAGILVYLVGHPASFNMPEPVCPATGRIEKSDFTRSHPFQRESVFAKTTYNGNALIAQAPAAAPKSTATAPPQSTATPKGGECKPCRVWAVTFLEGATPPNKYKAALDKGIALLSVARQAAQQQNDEKQVSELRDQIDLLRELRNNLNDK